MTIRVSLTDAQLAEIQRQMGRYDPDLPTVRLWIIELAAQGTLVPVISQTVGLSEINARKWLHRYEAHGIDGLRTGKSPGRPLVFDAERRAAIVQAYQADPQTLGLGYCCWSLERLRSYLISSGIVESISLETLRQVTRYGEKTR